ncbi:MAG: GNAT family N-acetyltransferase [Rhodospirillales bacterium]|nr:GNAT family N-acetyltransferase [Rhodospirillales bacterium]
MSGITSVTDRRTEPHLAVYPSLTDLPAAALGLFADPATDLFASHVWFATLVAHALPEGWTPHLVLCRMDGMPAALLPLARTARRGSTLQSLTGFYSLTFRPLLAPGVSPAIAGSVIGQVCRRAGPVRLDALAPDAPGLDAFVAGLRHVGLAVLRFDHFGNWYEPVAGLSFGDYLAARPGPLRSTIRRKMRRAEAVATFSVITGEPQLTEGIASYEAIYARSWKEPEPFPAFHPALIRAVAENSLLRLGVLRLSGQPAAVQLWIVSGSRAILLKLAHDEAFAALSPGTVLTALMIEWLLGEEDLTELDFGCGDDPYKRLWTTHRRQRIGLLLVNPLRPRGLAEIGRSLLGTGWRRLSAARRPV